MCISARMWMKFGRVLDLRTSPIGDRWFGRFRLDDLFTLLRVVVTVEKLLELIKSGLIKAEPFSTVISE